MTRLALAGLLLLPCLLVAQQDIGEMPTVGVKAQKYRIDRDASNQQAEFLRDSVLGPFKGYPEVRIAIVHPTLLTDSIRRANVRARLTAMRMWRSGTDTAVITWGSFEHGVFSPGEHLLMRARELVLVAGVDWSKVLKEDVDEIRLVRFVQVDTLPGRLYFENYDSFRDGDELRILRPPHGAYPLWRYL